MKLALSNSAIEKLAPVAKKYVVWDTKVAGFGLVVHPGGRKSFIVRKPRFRNRNTPLELTIGAYGDPLTPEVARQKARKLRAQMDEGVDPRQNKTEAIQTLAEFAVVFSRDTDTRKKQSSIDLEHGLLKRHILPRLGRKPIASITAGDIRKFMSAVAEQSEPLIEKTKARGKAVVKGGPSVANRARRVLSAMFNHAIDSGLRTDNPCTRVKPLPEQARERFLSEQEIAALGEALTRAGERGANPYAVAAIRLILLTGARKNEILSLKWSFVDWDRGMALLPDSKTGAKALPLSEAALDVLRDIPKLDGKEWVLPSLKSDGHLIGLQKIWNDIRQDAGLADVRLHDLRHTFASIAVSHGHSLYVVGKALGHARPSTTQRYAHLKDDPVRATVNDTADIIARGLGNKPSNLNAST